MIRLAILVLFTFSSNLVYAQFACTDLINAQGSKEITSYNIEIFQAENTISSLSGFTPQGHRFQLSKVLDEFDGTPVVELTVKPQDSFSAIEKQSSILQLIILGIENSNILSFFGQGTSHRAETDFFGYVVSFKINKQSSPEEVSFALLKLIESVDRGYKIIESINATKP